jgi:HD-GYP domain-containing protein (c-di-GMP phosphodiesterase class II)
MRTAGLFHDIGKVGVPDAILLKNGPLTSDEFAEIKLHPAAGEKVLSTYSPFSKMLPVIRGHHERIDGSGYPDGLAGDEICIGARIIAVADSFDAMVSNRTYRKGLGIDKAVSEIIRCKGTQFDPVAADCFLSIFNKLGKDEFMARFCSHVLENGGID